MEFSALKGLHENKDLTLHKGTFWTEKGYVYKNPFLMPGQSLCRPRYNYKSSYPYGK